MAKLRNLFRQIISLVFPIEDALYFLQLEEYDSSRYFRHLGKLILSRNLQRRDTLKNTPHIKILRWACLVGYGLILLTSVVLALSVHPIWLLLLATFPLVSIDVLIANIIAMPYYNRLTIKNESAAKDLVSSKFPDLKVVAVTGSFGKTTTKNFIYELVKYSYKTQMIPGNINTAIGIANWILRELNPGTEVLVVEMGAYTTGEIARSCRIVAPDIAIITALSEQHLERFGSFDSLIEAKLEIFRNSKQDSSKLIPQRYSELISKKYEGDYVQVDQSQPLSYLGGNFETNIEFVPAIENLHLALTAAEKLEIKKEFVFDSAKKLSLPERRKDVKTIRGFEVIDDSYNISFQSAVDGLQFASEYASKSNKRLFVITAGIPELGRSNLDANTEYGEILSKSNASVIVLDSILAPQILKGFRDDSVNLISSNLSSVSKAFDYLEDILDTKGGCIIYLQPELNDLYY